MDSIHIVLHFVCIQLFIVRMITSILSILSNILLVFKYLLVECSSGFYGQNCQEVCQCSANSVSCDHIDGSCTCSAGWEGAVCELDVDECQNELHNCSGEFEYCFNTIGNFRCDCDKGYLRDQENVCIGTIYNYLF